MPTAECSCRTADAWGEWQVSSRGTSKRAFMAEQLQVVVNGELTLDAGWWEETGGGIRQRIIHPPGTTMFEQVPVYLEHVADSRPERNEGLSIGREAVAATAVCLRWGSYLAVLLDRSKPVCDAVQDPEHSRISNSEMARINVEASAALESWIELMRRDYWRYQALVSASQRLPMPQRTVTRDPGYALLSLPSRPNASSLMALPDHGETCDRAVAHPSRTLANALINACWRNGPVEGVHAGCWGTYPLRRCRVTLKEEQFLMRTTASRLAHGLSGFSPDDPSDLRPWTERVLPYAFAHELLVTPREWALEEKTRPVCLVGWEQ